MKFVQNGIKTKIVLRFSKADTRKMGTYFTSSKNYKNLFLSVPMVKKCLKRTAITVSAYLNINVVLFPTPDIQGKRL